MLAPPCFTVFTVYCGLNSVFAGRLTNCLWPLDPKRTILLSSVHKILRHFFLGQSMCYLANCNRFITCIFFNNGTLRGLLGGSLASDVVWLLQYSQAILDLLWSSWSWSLAEPLPFWLFSDPPRLSGFGCHFKAFDIILAEQPIIFCTSL